jgi:hypothetical protein
MTLDDIKDAWPDEEFPRKGTMLKVLADGAEQGDWKQNGRGVKGDPPSVHSCPILNPIPFRP